MIKWEIIKGGYAFSLVEFEKIPWIDWQNNLKKSDIYSYQILKEYIDNNLAETYEKNLIIKTEDLYSGLSQNESSQESLTEIEQSIRFLGLPPFYSNEIFLKYSGDLHKSNLMYKIIYCENVTSAGPDNIHYLLRKESVLIEKDSKDPYFTLDPYQYKFVNLVETFNSLTATDKTYRNNLDYLAKIKKAANKASVKLHKTIESQDVYTPKSLKLSINKNEKNELEIKPEIDDFNEDFQIKFDKRINIDDVYNVQDKNGNRTRIPVSENQKKGLVKVKQYRRISDQDLIQKIVEHPEDHFNSEEIDYSVFYSDRVLEIGLYKPKIYPFVSPYKSDWIPGYIIENKIDGNIKVYIKTDEDLNALDDLVEQGLKNNDINVSFKGNNIPIIDAEDILTTAKKQFKDRSTPVRDKKVLIIKENAELLEYEEKHDLIDFEHILELIPDIVSGISLMRHQKEGVAWLQSLSKKGASGCLLADDMGLGKTIQALSFIQWMGKKKIQKSLIVAPVSLIENWQEEYKKFFTSIPYTLLDDRNDLAIIKDLPNSINDLKNGTLIIISYSTLRRYQLQLCKVNWNIVILDEAQNIKTPGRIVTNAAKALKAEFRIAMTGTPVENTFHDIWSIMDFCVPGLLGSAKEFNKKYGVKKTDSVKEVEFKGEEIRQKIGIFIKRRLKSEISKELPQKYESNNDLHLSQFKAFNLERNMPPVQLDTYTNVIHTQEDKESKENILKIIGRLKKISDHPYLDTDLLERSSTTELIDNSARTLVLLDILDKVKSIQEKVILFAEFRATQRLLAHIITEKYGIYPSVINGGTRTTATKSDKSNFMSRQQLINKFNNSTGFNIIVMSPIAAGVGLNVTGANHVIHYSRHWNPAKEDQATDRAYRIGQKKDVFVYFPKAISDKFRTFDLVLDDLLRRKKNLSKATLYPSEMAEVRTSDILSDLGV